MRIGAEHPELRGMGKEIHSRRQLLRRDGLPGLLRSAVRVQRRWLVLDAHRAKGMVQSCRFATPDRNVVEEVVPAGVHVRAEGDCLAVRRPREVLEGSQDEGVRGIAVEIPAADQLVAAQLAAGMRLKRRRRNELIEAGTVCTHDEASRADLVEVLLKRPGDPFAVRRPANAAHVHESVGAGQCLPTHWNHILRINGKYVTAPAILDDAGNRIAVGRPTGFQVVSSAIDKHAFIAAIAADDVDVEVTSSVAFKCDVPSVR